MNSPPPPPPPQKKKCACPLGISRTEFTSLIANSLDPGYQTLFLCTLYIMGMALGFITFVFSDVPQICAHAEQPLGLVLFITSYPMGRVKSMAHLDSLTVFSGACDFKSHISCKLVLTSSRPFPQVDSSL